MNQANRALKVLMLTSSYPSTEHSLGPFIQTLARGVASLGVQVTLLMYSPNGTFRRWKDKGVTVIEYPYSFFLPPVLHRHAGLIPTVKKSTLAKIEFPLYLFSSWRYLKKYAGSADLIHAHWYLPSGLIAALARKSIGKPLITTAWGAEFHLPPNFLAKKILAYVHNRSDKRITVSRYMQDQAKKYGLLHLDVIPNSVDEKAFHLPRRRLERLVVGTVRRLVPEKRISLLIEAVALLPLRIRKSMQVWIIGDGPERGELEQLAQRKGISQMITFFGALPHTDIPKYLSKIDIFVNPSVQEGMATANLEAMAAGCCVIASHGVGNDEVIKDRKTGFLFEAGSAQSLSQTIHHVARDSLERSGVSHAAQQDICTRFSQERIARLYLSTYRACLREAEQGAQES